MTVWGSPEKDNVGREERRIERLTDWSKRYIQRLNSAYTRAVGSQAISRLEERKLFDQGRYDLGAARQLFMEVKKRSVSTQDAMERLLKWGKRFQ
ncbi:MAG TPA: hypothetical protein VJA25_14990 [Dehalococcoidia bacterium]|nr:hypothetical protein [Dehalococcoidia bacterium]